jgi:nucleotide-binding universal stress UspA family protein
MAVLVWITDDTWAACVDAARALAPPADDITLLHVMDTAATDAARGAFTALLGRSGADPAARLEALAESDAREVLDSAAARLGRPARKLGLRGRPEHQVVTMARDMALLILAREGVEAGPRSLGKAARFVVDHAACPVLLVWPGPVREGRPPPPDGRKPPHGRRKPPRPGPPPPGPAQP